jgi:hypothetical protein
MGDEPVASLLPAQDNTAQKDADIYGIRTYDPSIQAAKTHALDRAAIVAVR